jgi:catechol 2,3-dioxygenase-like lactoylglutathione lyase family enzyme
MVTSDLERTADLYTGVFGFKRMGDVRKPGNFPGLALPLSDGEVNFQLLTPNDDVPIQDWAYGTMGPNHIGIEVEDTRKIIDALEERGVDVYGVDASAEPPRFFKFRDPDGAEIDVASRERSWKF